MKKLVRFTGRVALNLILGVTAFAQHYTQTNLVSNMSGVAPVTDPQLINAWGLSRGSGTPWWVSDEATGLSTLYNGAGAKQSLIVTIPPADPTNKNTPTRGEAEAAYGFLDAPLVVEVRDAGLLVRRSHG